MSNSDPEQALEEALKRIQGDSNESDDPNESDDELHSPQPFPSSTYATSENSARLLCMPPRTRLTTSANRYLHRPPQLMVKNSKDTLLTQNHFCEMVCKKLAEIAEERWFMRQRAEDIARECGKSFNEIKSVEWSDAPESTQKYISLSKNKLYDREPSCNDSGLGISYLSQSSSDLCCYSAGTAAADSVSSYCSSGYVQPTEMSLSSRPHPSFSMRASSSLSIPCSSYSHTLLPTAPHPTMLHQSPLPHTHINHLLVAYTFNGSKDIFAKRVTILTPSLSLREFKEDVFARKGQYRFFFKRFCEELNCVIFEEMSHDSQMLPLFEGKIVGQVVIRDKL